jgi:hypothetical protein
MDGDSEIGLQLVRLVAEMMGKERTGVVHISIIAKRRPGVHPERISGCSLST